MGQNFIFVIVTWNIYKLGYLKVAEKRISDLLFLAHMKSFRLIDHFGSYLEETDCPKIPHLKIQVGKFGTAFVSYLGTKFLHDNND